MKRSENDKEVLTINEGNLQLTCNFKTIHSGHESIPHTHHSQKMVVAPWCYKVDWMDRLGWNGPPGMG